MESVLILGAGAAAAAAASALAARGIRATILDVGEQLPADHRAARDRLAKLPTPEWSPTDLATITKQPEAAARVRGLPEKRTFGSDYPFTDAGQRDGISATDAVNSALVSGAYGGFTNVWGAQLMPFSAATFRDWPVSFESMRPHYAALLSELPFAGEDDDLAELFPLLASSVALPQLSERSERVLARYRRHRDRLRARGVILGRARLAMQANQCVRCGLCMTGCPYSLIYSAAHTLDRLRASGEVRYHGGLLATRIDEGPDGVTVTATELRTGTHHEFNADRVLVACGAIGSTRLVLGSLEMFDRPIEVAESTQFMLPFVSARPTADPRGTKNFTLNQFNMVVRLGDDRELSQLHFYTYNDAFPENLPGALRGDRAEPIRRAALRRLTVALGYLPSWAAPTFRVTARKPGHDGELPALDVTADDPHFTRNPFLRQVLRRVTGSARALDLWPALPVLQMSAPGKSYHWGATFPHSQRPDRGATSSDVLGRVGTWRRVHLVDAAVFPTVPATTFTLTIMANAHRIADAVAEELACHPPR